VINHIRSLGKPAVFHSDGNISQFLDDLVNIGISGLNPIERNSGMDLADLKRKFGHKICLFGNVDNKKILSDGTLEEIEEDVMNCIRAAGKGGGFVLMSDNSWHLGVSPKNAQAMVGAGRKWGRYPLDWIEKSNQGR
jgi:uroporphyrinogen decarboxylase